ncbi:MAG: hypothetical protein AB1638_00940 [Nitrospirota bacterium]
MQIKYSKHLKTKTALRKIDYELPKKIFEDAEERFIEGQKESRIKSGRWRKI